MTELSDTEPYVLRQGKGDLVDLELIGGSVGWNQLIPNGNFASTNAWSTASDRATFSVSNNIGSLTNIQSGIPFIARDIPVPINHKFFISITSKITTSSGESCAVGISLRNVWDVISDKTISLSSKYRENATILSSVSAGTKVLYEYQVNNYTSSTVINFKNAQAIDLTLLFGSEVADYIYNLEQTNEGAGVAFFRKYFPNEYYAYDAGSLQSVYTIGRKVVGKNLFDPNTFIRALLGTDGSYVTTDNWITSDYVPIFSNNQVVVSGWRLGSESNFCVRFCEYDESKNFIKNTSNINIKADIQWSKVITLDPRTRFIRATFGFDSKTTSINAFFNTNNIQIELGSTLTTIYKPYTSTTCAFDSSKELRGIPQLVDNKLNYNGDVYRADGSITRKYGIVDLGSLDWAYAANWGQQKVSLFYTILESSSRRTINNAICAKYPVVPVAIGNNLSDDSMVIGSPYISGERTMIGIADNSYSDTSTFKTAMSGVYLIYELAIPTTESASAYQNPQRSYSDGTEQFIDGITRDVMVPVGNTSKYTSNEVIPVVEDYVDGKFTHESVSVTADGVKTYGTLLNELQALVDYTKVTDYSYLKMGSTVMHTTVVNTSGRALAGGSVGLNGNPPHLFAHLFLLTTNDSHYYWADGSTSTTDRTSTIASNGTIIKVVY